MHRFGYNEALTLELPHQLKEMSDLDLRSEQLHSVWGSVTPELSSEAIRFLTGLLDSSLRQLDIEGQFSPGNTGASSSSSVSYSVIEEALSVLSVPVKELINRDYYVFHDFSDIFNFARNFLYGLDRILVAVCLGSLSPVWLILRRNSPLVRGLLHGNYWPCIDHYS